MNFYENFIVENAFSDTHCRFRVQQGGKGEGENTKYSNAYEHMLGEVGREKGWGGEKRAFKIPTECATLKQLIVVIVPFRGTRKLRVQLARLAR